MVKPRESSKQLLILERPPSATRQWSHRALYVSSSSMNFGLDEEQSSNVVKFLGMLDKKSPKALPFLEDIIRDMSDGMKQHVKNWTDERGFDILQSSIIHNRPDVIHFLLHTPQLFPDTHHPKMNPYAHLAATLGNLECLKEILNSRPNYYFKTSAPHHSIRLPLQILPLPKRTGLSRNLERLMSNVIQDTAIAERAIRHDKDEQRLLDNEFEVFKNSLSKKDIKSHKMRQYTSIAELPSSSQVEIKKPFVKKPDVVMPSLRPNAPKPKAKPKITVFWDVFKDDKEGVVKGAGEPIEINHVQDKTRSHTIVERKDVVNYDTRKSQPKLKKAPKRQPPAKRSATSQARLNEGRPPISSMSINQHNSCTGGMDSLGSSKTSPGSTLQGKIELGVRRIKKYKEFVPILEPKKTLIDDPNKYYGKTPLTMAAEKGHVDCVNYLLNTFYYERKSSLAITEPLTLATKAKSPESLAILLGCKYTKHDYQSAVLTAIRELYPDCLAVLLNIGSKDRGQLFDGTNLFHILYSQSLITDYRYGMLPEMTRILVNSKEEINARYPHKTYPMYTLIQCAFNVAVGKQLLYYLECLTMLLNANGNPRYNENRGARMTDNKSLKLSRPSYTSAIHCVLANAHSSLQYFEKSQWYQAQIIMHKFIDIIATHDKTPRQVDNDILFDYMDYISQLGLNRRILRTLLRYGANPDYSIDGKYPLTIFFEQMFAFLTKFEVNNKYVTKDDMLDTLLILCRAMTPLNLHKAVTHFLDNHLLSTPLQALDITRKFCYYANKMITSPRSLTHIVSQVIWLHLKRNSKRVFKLPIPQDAIQQILP